jgi:hypothetical protein
LAVLAVDSNFRSRYKKSKAFLVLFITASYATQITSQSVLAGYLSGAWQITYFLQRLSFSIEKLHLP